MFQRIAPLAIIALVGCKDPVVNDTDDTDTEAVDRVSRVVVSADGPTAEVVAGHNRFAWDLYAELADDDDDNVFFSPFSTTSALGLTAAGAEGDTLDEMAAAMGIPADAAAWHAALGALTQDLSGNLGRGYTLHIANRLFGQADYPFETSFLTLVDDAYDAPLEETDFIADPESSRERVNTWVEDQTNDRIEDLLPQGSIDTDTRLVLANAIYFLADWDAPFDPEMTSTGDFTTLSGDVVQADLMMMDTGSVQDAAIGFAHTDGLSIVSIPYEDRELSMVLLVPDADDGLPAIEAQLDQATFDGWVESTQVTDLTLIMPKFTFEYEAELSNPLKALGMTDLFDSTAADLTGIADPSDGNLFVSGVFHKAFVAVDELGTEAAAATAVVVGVESAGAFVSADHAFAFVIRDDLTGTILFVGRVSDPS